MADRTVSVGLQLKVDAYKGGIDEAIVKTTEFDEKVKRTNDGLDKTERKATEAAAALKLLGVEGGSSMLKLNDGIGENTRSLDVLESKLLEARLETRRLADEFNRTGNGATLDKLFNQQKATKDLEELKKKLTSALEDGAKDAGPTAGKTLSKSVGESFSGAEALGTPMIAGLLYVAPAIPAIIGAGVAAGFGIGAIAGAAYLQKDSPALSAAFSGLASDVKNLFKDASGTLAEPLAAVTGDFDKWLKGLAPQFTRIFQSVAPAIKPVEKILEDILQPIIKALPNLGRAFSEVFSDPKVQRAFTVIGDSIGQLVGTIAANGRTIAVVFEVIGIAVKALTAIFDGLMNAMNALVAGGEKVLTFLSGGKIKFDEVSGAAKGAASALNEAAFAAATAGPDYDALSQALDKTTNNADTLAGKMTDKLLGSILGVQNATLSWHTSLSDLRDSLDKNGHSFDENTRAGQQNMQTLLSLIAANKQVYDSNIANGMSASDAAKKFDENTQALDKVLKKAGLTNKQIQDLTGSMNDVPDQVDSNIAMKGLTDAINGLDDLIRQLNGLPPRKGIEVVYNEYHVIHGSQSAYASGGIRRAATGLIVGPSDPGTLIGEPQTGGEALIPLRGISSGRAQMLGNVAMSGYGMQVVPRSAPMAVAGGGTRTLQPITIALPSGEPLVRTIIEYALNTGRSPSQLWPAASR